MAEIPIVPVGASIANALKQASGVRYYQLPLTPGRVLSKLHDQGQG
jgi:CO/xanthine dehydrogenase Mo-binding subunit